MRQLSIRISRLYRGPLVREINIFFKFSLPDIIKQYNNVRTPFTGTGKTVVGVYIVFWFHNLNTKTNLRNTDRAEQGKKDVILYCGPSNKSVDVVAGK